MDSTQLESLVEVSKEPVVNKECIEEFVSLEAEIPEALYNGLKDFVSNNPNWDQYTVMSSALANFLFQNGSDDRAIVERYLNDLFNLSNS